MRRYQFHSTLPPEEVFARLEAKAKQGWRCFGWQHQEEFFCVRRGERFRLAYTGIVPARGYVPFRGTVRAAETGSVICGSFSLLREFGPLFALGGGAFWIAGLCAGQPALPFLGLTALWLLILFGFFAAMDLIFFWNRRRVLIRFIEDNLLH